MVANPAPVRGWGVGFYFQTIPPFLNPWMKPFGAIDAPLLDPPGDHAK